MVHCDDVPVIIKLKLCSFWSTLTGVHHVTVLYKDLSPK